MGPRRAAGAPGHRRTPITAARPRRRHELRRRQPTVSAASAASAVGALAAFAASVAGAAAPLAAFSQEALSVLRVADGPGPVSAGVSAGPCSAARLAFPAVSDSAGPASRSQSERGVGQAAVP